MKKNIRNGLVGLVCAGALASNAQGAGFFKINNLVTASGGGNVGGTTVDFVQSGNSSNYSAGTYLSQIYSTDGTNNYSVVPVNPSNSVSEFFMPLSYGNNFAGNTNNFFRLRFVTLDGSGGPTRTNNFPSDLLITMKYNVGSSNGAIDVIKSLQAASGQFIDIPLPKITNAVAGQVYGSNWISFRRKDSSLPLQRIEDNFDGSANITVSNSLPGENVILQSSSDLSLGNWEDRGTNYIPVNAQNYGTNSSTIFSNVPSTNSSESFRAKIQ